MGKILHDNLDIRKLTAKQVSRLLIIDQKRQQVCDSKTCLDIFNCNTSDFLHRLVTIDERWIHHYIPESKQQAKQWVGHAGTAPKRAKAQQSTGKVMASVFWDSSGILFIEYLRKGKKINRNYYCILLNQLKEETTRKWPNLLTKKFIFLQDRSIKTKVKINKLCVQLLSR